MEVRPRAQSQALLIRGRLEEHGLTKVGSGCVEVDRKAEQKDATGRVGFSSARRQLSSSQIVRFLTTEALTAASRPTTKTMEVCMMGRRTMVNQLMSKGAGVEGEVSQWTFQSRDGTSLSWEKHCSSLYIPEDPLDARDRQ